MNLEEASNRARQALKEFSVLPSDVVGARWQRRMLSGNEFPLPELVYVLLNDLIGIRAHKPFEKVRWSFSATFNGCPFGIALCKFGLELTLPEGVDEDVGDTILKKLQRGARIAETYLRGIMEQQIHAGNVTLSNKWSQFDYAYRHFRDTATCTFQLPPPEPQLEYDDNGRVIGGRMSPWKREIDGWLYATAMLDVYFSRLEHLLVIILPFTAFNPESGALAQFIRSSWDQKFRNVFDLPTDSDAKLTFESLKGLKEKFRNPQSHGGFMKGNASFFFHVKGLGALPASLAPQGFLFDQFQFGAIQPTFAAVCSDLDQCDSFLRGSPVSGFGYRFAESGLDPSFASASRDRYRDAMTSTEAFEEFIDYEHYQWSRHVNMDF